MAPRAHAFTLIELLIVVTIIVVLLALLTPALDRAIGQAETAACAGNLKGVGSGSIQYAFDQRRSYFYREAVRHAGIGYYEPRNLNVPFHREQTANPNGFDDRPMMSPYVVIKSLQCPPSGEANLEEEGTNSFIFASYSLWVGWKYDLAGQDGTKPSSGMFKVGNKLGYDGKRYSVLAGDTSQAGLFALSSAHPDGLGKLALTARQSKAAPGGAVPGPGEDNRTYSFWYTSNLADVPGKFEMNFTWDDGSVRRLNEMDWNSGEGDWFGTWIDPEPRTESVPAHKNTTYSGWGVLAIPKGQ